MMSASLAPVKAHSSVPSGKTEDLQQQKADGVVRADADTFPGGRKVLADHMKFDGRGKGGKKSAPTAAPHIRQYSLRLSAI